MSSDLKRRWGTVQILPNLTDTERKALLSKSDPALVKAISEICHNLLEGNITLDETDRKKLAKWKKLLRKLSNKRLSIRKKRGYLVQSGNFLSILLPVVASIVSLIAAA